MISDEAVKAAAIALYDRKHIEGVGLADVRRALEAAAPYLLAEAWDEGLEYRADGGYIHPVEYEANPYRSQA